MFIFTVGGFGATCSSESDCKPNVGLTCTGAGNSKTCTCPTGANFATAPSQTNGNDCGELAEIIFIVTVRQTVAPTNFICVCVSVCVCLSVRFYGLYLDYKGRILIKLSQNVGT